MRWALSAAACPGVSPAKPQRDCLQFCLTVSLAPSTQTLPGQLENKNSQNCSDWYLKQKVDCILGYLTKKNYLHSVVSSVHLGFVV